MCIGVVEEHAALAGLEWNQVFKKNLINAQRADATIHADNRRSIFI